MSSGRWRFFLCFETTLDFDGVWFIAMSWCNSAIWVQLDGELSVPGCAESGELGCDGYISGLEGSFNDYGYQCRSGLERAQLLPLYPDMLACHDIDDKRNDNANPAILLVGCPFDRAT